MSRSLLWARIYHLAAQLALNPRIALGEYYPDTPTDSNLSTPPPPQISPARHRGVVSPLELNVAIVDEMELARYPSSVNPLTAHYSLDTGALKRALQAVYIAQLDADHQGAPAPRMGYFPWAATPDHVSGSKTPTLSMGDSMNSIQSTQNLQTPATHDQGSAEGGNDIANDYDDDDFDVDAEEFHYVPSGTVTPAWKPIQMVINAPYDHFEEDKDEDEDNVGAASTPPATPITGVPTPKELEIPMITVQAASDDEGAESSGFSAQGAHDHTGKVNPAEILARQEFQTYKATFIAKRNRIMLAEQRASVQGQNKGEGSQ